jgi:hypothetical protein
MVTPQLQLTNNQLHALLLCSFPLHYYRAPFVTFCLWQSVRPLAKAALGHRLHYFEQEVRATCHKHARAEAIMFIMSSCYHASIIHPVNAAAHAAHVCPLPLQVTRKINVGHATALIDM